MIFKNYVIFYHTDVACSYLTSFLLGVTSELAGCVSPFSYGPLSSSRQVHGWTRGWEGGAAQSIHVPGFSRLLWLHLAALGACTLPRRALKPSLYRCSPLFSPLEGRCQPGRGLQGFPAIGTQAAGEADM